MISKGEGKLTMSASVMNKNDKVKCAVYVRRGTAKPKNKQELINQTRYVLRG